MKIKNYQMMFERKNYGRFFVEKEEDIPLVKEIMKDVDEYEFNQYYPTGNCLGGNGELITVFNEENFYSIYTHKFDSMDMTEVLQKCWQKGIKCFVVFGEITGYEE